MREHGQYHAHDKNVCTKKHINYHRCGGVHNKPENVIDRGRDE